MRPKLILGVLVFSATMWGCSGGNTISQDEVNRAKAARFDDAARAKVVSGMQAGAAAAAKQKQDWAAQNPERLAKINAERAAMGRPPLTGK
jgi:hypothetical protein